MEIHHTFLCWVSSQDMADSRRINSNIREEESRLSEEEQPPLSLSSIILSSEFWPPLKEEKLELPPLVCQAMEAYTHRYEKLKVEFTCCFKPSLVLFDLVVYHHFWLVALQIVKQWTLFLVFPKVYHKCCFYLLWRLENLPCWCIHGQYDSWDCSWLTFL